MPFCWFCHEAAQLFALSSFMFANDISVRWFVSCASLVATVLWERAHEFSTGTVHVVCLVLFPEVSIPNSCCELSMEFVCISWTASSEFGTYRLCEQRRFRRACASAQSHQNLRCSLIQAVNQAEPSDRKPDPWPL